MAGRGYAAVVEPVFDGFPRGARGYQLLHTVVHKKIRTQIALADYLGMDRTVLPYVVDDLEAAGLVERRDDPTDRRVRTVMATDGGVERYHELARSLAVAEERFLSDLSASQREVLRSGLSSLAQHARSHRA